MTEDDAKAWFATRFGDGAAERVARFLDLVVVENGVQNLISPSTVPTIWARHAVDSAQLLALVPDWSSWIDIGTGGGFPGVIVALLAEGRAITLVEPRRKRAAFLQHCVDALSLADVRVVQTKVEILVAKADVISARAVASIDGLLQAARHCATNDTSWLLPRGGLADDDHFRLGSLRSTMFHVEHSITDPGSAIVILRGAGR